MVLTGKALMLLDTTDWDTVRMAMTSMGLILWAGTEVVMWTLLGNLSPQKGTLSVYKDRVRDCSLTKIMQSIMAVKPHF